MENTTTTAAATDRRFLYFTFFLFFYSPSQSVQYVAAFFSSKFYSKNIVFGGRPRSLCGGRRRRRLEEVSFISFVVCNLFKVYNERKWKKKWKNRHSLCWTERTNERTRALSLSQSVKAKQAEPSKEKEEEKDEYYDDKWIWMKMYGLLCGRALDCKRGQFCSFFGLLQQTTTSYSQSAAIFVRLDSTNKHRLICNLFLSAGIQSSCCNERANEQRSWLQIS